MNLILKFKEWGKHTDAVTISCLTSGKFGLGDKEIFSLSLSLKKIDLLCSNFHAMHVHCVTCINARNSTHQIT